jgi:RNA ligase (TIGR02306 family)
MSSFAVTIEQVEILPHPNADALELARIGGYRACVEKGRYQTGDWVLYIPEQAVLPPELIEELGLVGKLAGKDQNRVKAIKLRGELSQGIVCRPEKLGPLSNYGPIVELAGIDLSSDFGITKWEPPVPASLSGQAFGTNKLVSWPDIENLKRYPNIFVPGEDVVVTEKIHGSCCIIVWRRGEPDLFVSSKGLASKHRALLADPHNQYWRAVEKYEIRDKIEAFTAKDPEINALAVFGEVYGAGIQDLHYGVNAGTDGPGFVAFDLWIEYDGYTGHMQDAVFSLEDLEIMGIPTVPLLYEGEFSYDWIAKLASGEEGLSGEGLHIREGVVVRPREEATSDVTGSRKIAKFVSDEYLTRKDGTEYE